MALMIIGILVFFGVHAVTMQRDMRAGLIERFGAGPYKGVFSVLSIVGFVLIVVGYGKLQMLPGKNPQIWIPPSGLDHLALALMLPAIILLVAAYVPSNIKRIAKHPMLLAIKLWALAHLLANGDLASIVLFGSFLIYAVVNRISHKRREPAGSGAAEGGVSGGQIGGRMGGLAGDAVVVLAGIGLYIAIALFLHERLIGVAPMAGMAS